LTLLHEHHFNYKQEEVRAHCHTNDEYFFMQETSIMSSTLQPNTRTQSSMTDWQYGHVAISGLSTISCMQRAQDFVCPQGTMTTIGLFVQHTTHSTSGRLRTFSRGRSRPRAATRCRSFSFCIIWTSKSSISCCIWIWLCCSVRSSLIKAC
ncbi:hypothetical protein RvY_15190, partial [Ramazzottius varieornatus]